MTAGTGTTALQNRLLIGVLMLMWGAGTCAFGDDTVPMSSAWASLRPQTGASPVEPLTPLDQGRAVFRQAPALTGRFEIKDRTFIPFIGAGFGGGYTNDRDRALGSNGLFHNPIQSGDLGKNMMPNEFNLGLRIPF